MTEYQENIEQNATDIQELPEESRQGKRARGGIQQPAGLLENGQARDVDRTRTLDQADTFLPVHRRVGIGIRQGGLEGHACVCECHDGRGADVDALLLS